MAEIIPAVLSKSLDEIRESLSPIVGFAPVVHIDICDGILAKEKTWPYGKTDAEEFRAITEEKEGLPFWEDFDFEIHLMTVAPEKILDDWVKAGAARIIIHAEVLKDSDRAKEILDGRAKLGLALNLDTFIEDTETYVGNFDFIQLMAIARIGSQGVEFDDKIFGKIEMAHKKFPGKIISIDGGVSLANAKKLIRAGADRLVVGSAIFGEGDAKDNLLAFEEEVR